MQPFCKHYAVIAWSYNKREYWKCRLILYKYRPNDMNKTQESENIPQTWRNIHWITWFNPMWNPVQNAVRDLIYVTHCPQQKWKKLQGNTNAKFSTLTSVIPFRQFPHGQTQIIPTQTSPKWMNLTIILFICHLFNFFVIHSRAERIIWVDGQRVSFSDIQLQIP